jgi:hypothetical protein
LPRLRILPIVEGHGDSASIRILLQRIGTEILAAGYIEILKALRKPKSQLVRESDLKKTVELAALKLRGHPSPDHALILILVDADDDAPCELGPRLLSIARNARSDIDIACVVANVEYETWFIAAAESLAARNRLWLAPGESPPSQPEETRSGAAWIQNHFPGARYSKTVDQPALTQAMDLTSCRERSPSFDKLCRDLQAALSRAGLHA